MLSSILLYLAEATFCLAVFALVYRFLLAGLTYFAWNRAYLLGALAASTVLPLLAFPGLEAFLATSVPSTGSGPLPFRLNWQLGTAAENTLAPVPTADPMAALPLILISLYALGAFYKLFGTARNLRALTKLARCHPQTRLDDFSIVHLPTPGLPAFSFSRFVFLSPSHEALSTTERQLLLQHEQVHVLQHHTLDLLLVEAMGVLFWFNALVPYFGKQLKAVHEYLADATVARTQNSPVGYGELLVKLAAQQPPFALIHTFSNKQIFLRIQMLTRPISAPAQKLRFLLVVPVIAFAWVATACAGSPTPEAATPAAATLAAAAPAAASRIGRITWQGNTFLSTTELNQALGFKTGDVYDSAAVAQRLNFDPKGSDVTSRYMDHGYLFFSVIPSATRQADGTTDLTFAINEGRKAQLGTISFTGNTKTSTSALLKLVPLRSGQDFSRAKLMETQRILAQQGQFDPSQIGINPRPIMRANQATDLVDVQVVLVEKAKP